MSFFKNIIIASILFICAPLNLNAMQNQYDLDQEDQSKIVAISVMRTDITAGEEECRLPDKNTIELCIQTAKKYIQLTPEVRRHTFFLLADLVNNGCAAKDPFIIEIIKNEIVKETKDISDGVFYLLASLVENGGTHIYEQLIEVSVDLIDTSLQYDINKDYDSRIQRGALYLLTSLIEAGFFTKNPAIIIPAKIIAEEDPADKKPICRIRNLAIKAAKEGLQSNNPKARELANILTELLLKHHLV